MIAKKSVIWQEGLCSGFTFELGFQFSNLSLLLNEGMTNF